MWLSHACMQWDEWMSAKLAAEGHAIEGHAIEGHAIEGSAEGPSAKGASAEGSLAKGPRAGAAGSGGAAISQEAQVAGVSGDGGNGKGQGQGQGDAGGGQPAIGAALGATNLPPTEAELSGLSAETVSEEVQAARRAAYAPHAVHFGHEVRLQLTRMLHAGGVTVKCRSYAVGSRGALWSRGPTPRRV